MSSAVHQPLLNMIATTAANGRNGGGGTSRGSRRICVISAALPERPAATKCQFGGLLPQARPPIRRKFGINDNTCAISDILNIFW